MGIKKGEKWEEGVESQPTQLFYKDYFKYHSCSNLVPTSPSGKLDSVLRGSEWFLWLFK